MLFMRWRVSRLPDDLLPRRTYARFCEQHASQEQRRYRRFERDPKINRRYGYAWQKIRDCYIAISITLGGNP